MLSVRQDLHLRQAAMIPVQRAPTDSAFGGRATSDRWARAPVRHWPSPPAPSSHETAGMWGSRQARNERVQFSWFPLASLSRIRSAPPGYGLERWLSNAPSDDR